LVRFLRSVVRSLKLVPIFLYAALELIVKRPATREQRAEWLHRFCARAMRQMGIAVRSHGEPPSRGVVVANHLGYLDIVAFAALRPCVFVAKLEIKDWPVLGWMTTMAGTVYVDRGHGGSAARAGSRMQAAADAGLPVVFFPEGTTSNGETVLKFHSGLLAQAMQGGQPITAAFVRYHLTQENGPGITVADDVCYWGDVSMLKHIFVLLGLRGIEVEVRFADSPIAFSETASRRKLAAMEARAAVMALGGLTQPAMPEASVPHGAVL
jgi:1-acyl-sn-glycerol-3-phosphate acyltransferase